MTPLAQEDESVRIVREIQVPVEKVYAAWVDPERLIRWIAPERFEATKVKVDLRVSGTAHVWGTDGDRQIGIFNWDFLEVVPNQRLVLSFAFADRDQDPDAHRSRLTIELRELGPDRTELSLFHEQLQAGTPWIAAGVTTGWGQVLGRLVTFLESTEDA